jgi:hypothetical protein
MTSVRVTSCHDDSIDLMSGVPQKTADSLHRQKSAGLGRVPTLPRADHPDAWKRCTSAAVMAVFSIH